MTEPVTIQSVFSNILLQDKKDKKVKKSSLIHEWLGRSDVTQSISIRLGNYLETFFREMMGQFNVISALTPDRKNFVIFVDGEKYQVDMLGTTDGDTWIAREIKCNLDLDTGKTRDVIKCESIIEKGLKEQFNVDVDSGVFCPFFYGTTKKDSRFGIVYGLEWFINTFDCDFTVDEFRKMGKSQQIHSHLFK